MALGDAAFSNQDIMRRFRAIESELRELRSARGLESSAIGAGGLRVKGEGGITVQNGGDLTVEDGGGISVTDDGGVTVTGRGVIRSDTFDGNMAVGDPGETGWALGRDRLALGGQLVGPVAFDAAGTEATGFSLSTTPTAKATATLTVPSWADEALVLAISSARVVNESAFDDVCFSTVRIGGQDGSEMLGVAASAGQSFSLTSVTAQHRRIIVNPGDTISCEARLSTSNNSWAANVTNRCAIDAIAIYRSTS